MKFIMISLSLFSKLERDSLLNLLYKQALNYYRIDNKSNV